MVEIGRVTAVLEVEDSKLDAGFKEAERKARDLDSKLSKPFTIGLGIGAAMSGMQMLISQASQFAEAIGPGSSMAWEKGMGSVIKTNDINKYVGDTHQLTAEYQQMNKDLLDLRANLRGVTQQDITGTASTLGSLGIAREQIRTTTETVLKDSAAFGMSSDETATKLATINTLWADQSAKMGGASNVFKQVGSAVNELGNNYSSTEANILSFLSEAGGTATVFGRSMQDTAAFGALLERVGIKGPEAATALRSAINEGLFAASVDTSKVPKGYKLASQMLGIGDQDMKSRLSNDLYGTLIDISSAVDKKYGADRAGKMEAFKDIFGSYGLQLGTKLAGMGPELQEMLGVSRKGFEEGTSAEKEYERQTDNLQGALDELTGSLDVARIEAWNAALQPATGTIENLASGVRTSTPIIKDLFGSLWSGNGLGVLDSLGKIQDGLVNAITQAGTHSIQTLQGLNWGDVGYVAGRYIGSSINSVLGVGDWLLGGVNSAITYASDKANWQSILDGLNAAGAGAIKALTPTFDHLSIVAYDAFIKVEKYSAPSLMWIKTAFQQIEFVGGQAWNELIRGASSFANMVSGSVVGSIQALIRGLGDLALSGAGLISSISGGGSGGQQSVTGNSASGKTYIATMKKTSSGVSYLDIRDEEGNQVSGVNYPSTFEGFNQWLQTQSIGQTLGNPLAGIHYGSVLSEFQAKAWSNESPVPYNKKGGDTGLFFSSRTGGKLPVDYESDFMENGHNRTQEGLQLTAEGKSLSSWTEEAINTAMAPVTEKVTQAAAPLTDKLNEAADSAKAFHDACDSSADSLDKYKTIISEDQLNQSLAVNPYTGKPYTTSENFDFAKQLAANMADENERIAGMENENLLNKAKENFGEQLKEGVSNYFEASGFADAVKQGFEAYKNTMSGTASAAAESAAALNTEAQAQSNLNQEVERGQDLLRKTAENAQDMCEAMSDFGLAQEENWDKLGLGFKSYVGSTGPQYDTFLQSEAARGAIHPGTIALGEDYSQPVTKPLQLDDSAARATLNAFDDTAKTPQEVPITADGSQANGVIEAIRANAAAGAYMPIYSSQVGGGDWWDAVTSPLGIPRFGAGDTFVSEPTLAVVGDRPGGEWIGGPDQARARFGGGTVSIDARVMINAPVYGVDDLEARLAAHQEETISRIYQAVMGN